VKLNIFPTNNTNLGPGTGRQGTELLIVMTPEEDEGNGGTRGMVSDQRVLRKCTKEGPF